MKHTIHIILILLLMAFAGILSTERVYGKGIRVVPKQMVVRGDSLHLSLDMDLNSIRVNRYTAIIFTPVLKGMNGKTELPPVIITGSSRYRFDRRERFLQAAQQVMATPFLVLLDSRQTPTKNIRYQVSVPYAAWMQGATLMLRKEIKDCCDPQLLGVDTLKKKVNLTNAPVSGLMASGLMTATAPAEKQARTIRPAIVPVASRKAAAARNLVPATYAADYASMVSFLQPDVNPKEKQHIASAILYIDYPLGKDDVYPEYKNNRPEIDKVDALLHPLLTDGFSNLRSLRIRGYSSPDGNYRDNEQLSAARSRLFANYAQRAYNIPRQLFDISSVAEDWAGLTELLERDRPSYYKEALGIISRYGIFNGREKHLMEFQGGTPYKDMLHRFFPLLRRIEIVVEYDIRSVDTGEASELIYTNPGVLSLAEMYQVARHYRPGTDQYREVYEIAAYHFPDDVVANVNAASAVMLTGDLQSAWNYLRKVESDPRSWNNMGVLTLMEGDAAAAEVWFRKAVGVEPQRARSNLQFVMENE